MKIDRSLLAVGAAGAALYLLVTRKPAPALIEGQLHSILTYLRCVYGVPEGATVPRAEPPSDSWDQYGPYASNQRLKVLRDGMGYWVNVSAPCLFPTGVELAPSYDVDVPANLVGWTEEPCEADSGGIADQIASVIDYVEAVWGYRNGGWEAPTAMEMYYGYYIAVTQGCILSYGGWSYPLLAGWNIIGWRGKKP